MATFTIHQRKLGKDKSDQINTDSNSDMANTYFRMGLVRRDNVDELVAATFDHDIYRMTTCLQVVSDHALTVIFDHMNGYTCEDVHNEIVLMKRPSMSVGDIVTNTGSGTSWVCMPFGWHELDQKIETKIAA
tara:strand:- start:1027 stop:1422 length:396 start_codon:yes stop_codon:yes gene_type:complete